MSAIRLTMTQALARALAAQRTVIDGREAPLVAGVWAIFGHGNVAALGEALWQARDALPTFRGHNEQAMALAAVGFARASRRRRFMACASSHRPGRDQYGHRRRHGACQPPAAAAPAGGRIRQPPPRPGPPAGRIVRRRHRDRQ